MRAFNKLRSDYTNITKVAQETIDELDTLLDADKAADSANKDAATKIIKKDKHFSLWSKNRDEWRQLKTASREWANEQYRAANKVVTATDTFLCVMYDKVSAVMDAVEWCLIRMLTTDWCG